MSFLKWALLRTVGNLAGNHAYYKERVKQVGSVGAKPINQGELQQQPQLDIESLLPGALAEFAEKVYGPSEPAWENKIRMGLSKVLDELQYMERLSCWSDANCCRFIEIHTFLHRNQHDQEVMNNIMRLDLKAGDHLGLTKMKECFQIINRITESAVASKIQSCSPSMEKWYADLSSHPEMCCFLAEGLYRVPGQPERCRRAHGELHLDGSDFVVTENNTLTLCSDCGGTVSKKAASCPHCGNPEVNRA